MDDDFDSLGSTVTSGTGSDDDVVLYIDAMGLLLLLLLPPLTLPPPKLLPQLPFRCTVSVSDEST